MSADLWEKGEWGAGVGVEAPDDCIVLFSANLDTTANHRTLLKRKAVLNLYPVREL